MQARDGERATCFYFAGDLRVIEMTARFERYAAFGSFL